jgi:methyl-accepting chemotaxis protein
MRDVMFRRRNYFVNPGLQLRYMAVLVLCMVLASFLTGFLMYFGIWGAVIPEFSEPKVAEKLEIASRLRDYDNARMGVTAEQAPLSFFKEARLLSAHEQQAVSYILDRTNQHLAPRIVVIILVIGAASVFISHKIAGPMVRIEKSLNSMANGDLTSNFGLRRGDEMKSLSGMLDNMAGIFRRKIEDSVHLLDDLVKDADKFSPDQVKAKAEEARKHLLYFKTGA